jgi:hypothetical protein
MILENSLLCSQKLLIWTYRVNDESNLHTLFFQINFNVILKLCYLPIVYLTMLLVAPS